MSSWEYLIVALRATSRTRESSKAPAMSRS